MLSRQDTVVRGVRPGPIFYSIVALTAAAALLTTTDLGLTRVAVFLFVVGAWTLSLIFHEFAHAYLAWRGGDRSVEQRGYLTLDPRAYTHPLLSFALPLVFIVMGGIGLPGGAVLLNRGALSDIRASVVAVAGPLTNLALGGITLGLLGSGVIDPTTSPSLAAAVGFFGFLQIAVFVLNMLPVPGFDGYAVIEPLLPLSTRQLLRPVATYGPLIAILAIWRFDALNTGFWYAVTSISDAVGVDRDIWRCGYREFRFWESDAGSGCS